MNAPVVLAVHTLGCPLDKPRIRRSDTFPGLIELLGDVDDLCRLGFGRIDFVDDVLRDEAPDLPVDTGYDPQQLATNTFRRHVDRDVRRARLCDVDNQQQRLSRARCRAQPDVAVDREALLVDSQVDEQVDEQGDVNVKSDAVVDVAGDLRLFDGHVGADFGYLARTLSHRGHVELAARDRGERRADALFGYRHLEKASSEGLVADVLQALHKLIPSHVG